MTFPTWLVYGLYLGSLFLGMPLHLVLWERSMRRRRSAHWVANRDPQRTRILLGWLVVIIGSALLLIWLTPPP